MQKVSTTALESQVVKEFGEQWTKYQENTGYYASLEVFKDIVEPLISVTELNGKNVADIGSGTGRIVRMLGEAGAATITAIEPSEAFEPLKKNTEHLKDRITYLNQKGDAWTQPNLDYIVSIGVVHHIVDPNPTIKNALKNLKPGGKFLIWVYGREGNESYLTFVTPLRYLTPKVPHFILSGISWILLMFLNLYVVLCHRIKLPMRDYMVNHIGRLDQYARRITIYDQLNPTWAKYYRREEAEGLLRDNGFVDVRSFHRHGYSWTVIGTKPV